MMSRFAILRRVGAVFRQFAARRPIGEYRLLPVHDGADVIGQIDTLTYFNGSMELEGRLSSVRAELDVDGKLHVIRAHLHRPQHKQNFAHGLQNAVELGGFSLTVHTPSMPANVTLRSGDAIVALPLPGMVSQKSRWLGVMAAFAFRILKSGPLIAKYLAGTRTEAETLLLRTRLGLVDHPNRRAFIDASLFADAGPTATGQPCPITIVMPIYNAFDVLRDALHRVVENTDLPWHLVLIEDCSDDAKLRPWLQDWAQAQGDHVQLLMNERNLGFIESVNRGFRVALERNEHVVLLNSDALVPKGWASRMMQPIVQDAKVASVTPLSNDATICSVPSPIRATGLAPDTVDAIDRVAAGLTTQAHCEVPTGVGFCMAMNREAVRSVPHFDLAYGKGYGEEVDWCRKLAVLGFVHRAAGNLFVEHKGGQSFGSTRKAAGTEKATRLINKRYPDFEGSISRFITHDPLTPARIAVAIGWAAASYPKVQLFVGHSLGGGAEVDLQRRLHAQEKAGRPSLVVRLGGNFRYRVEFHHAGDQLQVDVDEADVLRQVLSPLTDVHVVYSCGVGDICGIEIPQMLTDLTECDGASLTVLVHDYLVISPSYVLLNSDGKYSGLPDPKTKDAAHLPRLPNGMTGTLKDWQAAWCNALQHAEKIVVFSPDSKAKIAAAYPVVANQISVEPHTLPIAVPQVEVPKTPAKKVVGVLGAIGAQKGVAVLGALARVLTARRSDIEIILVGEYDTAFPLPKSVAVTGRYDVRDLSQIIASREITRWIMPSIWPETFSFTTHEMIATGLPVFCFDLGAQADAVRAYAKGTVLARIDAEDLADALEASFVSEKQVAFS